MNIHEKVRIGSMDYAVKLTGETIVLNAQECKGMIDYEFHEIKISNVVQDKQGQEQTFLHEVLHGIVRERNLDLQNTDDEIIIDEIAVGLHQVIRDNPKIFNTNVSGEKVAETTNSPRIKEEVYKIIKGNIANLQPISYGLTNEEIELYIKKCKSQK